MATPMLSSSLQLTAGTHDLQLDVSNNIRVVTGSLAIAQDVGCVVQTYLGECWYDTNVGIPYLEQVLGGVVNRPLWSSLYSRAALTVPNVVSATTSFAPLSPARKLSGTVKVIDTVGQSLNATF